MSILQERAVQMIHGLSDENVSFLIEIIQRLILQETDKAHMPEQCALEGLQAFQRLKNARSEIRSYLPDDFDPEKELRAAREERYGSAD